ncbi:putative cytochrome C biogenesis protein CcmB [Magnetofaba australis IT-1]|uniref:Heme exporter protein B n=1 Tax=Magnetofaba australis IT-1 TaxID=1434232 RepID=A0A1Y2K0I1_9PROT|nr:putative cytochrome C biogenesis protein CcmB [Magnetofaba australis IT-1]
MVGDLRRRATLSSMLFFSLSVLVIFQAGLEPNRSEALKLMPGLLWITLLFTSLVGLGRVFQAEEEDGALEGLLLSPMPRGVIFLGKWLGNLVLTALVALLLLPLMLILLNVDAWGALHLIIGVVLLGILGLTGLGVLLAAMTQAARARETLLALLLIPLVSPLLIAAVQATNGVLGLTTEIAAWIRLMLVFDVVYLAMAPWAFGWFVED